MSTTTYKIPIELSSTGNYTLAELKEKLMAYAEVLVCMSRTSSPKEEATDASGHTAWVQKMAKYRVLQPRDDKESLMEALDERYR